jgi:ATP-dependent RNA helicase SUPV3L1/SUV3
MQVAEDQETLRLLAKDARVTERARGLEGVSLLWQACRIPDFPRLLFESHVALVKDIFLRLCEGPLRANYLHSKILPLNKPSGTIDELTGRLAHIRTWAYVVHQRDFVDDATSFSVLTRQIEDTLSDALHQALLERYVDRRAKRVVLPSSSAATKSSPSRNTTFRTTRTTVPYDPSNGIQVGSLGKALMESAAWPKPPESEAREVRRTDNLNHLTAAATLRILGSGQILRDGRTIATLQGASFLDRPRVRLRDPHEEGARELERDAAGHVRDAIEHLHASYLFLTRHEDVVVRAVGNALRAGLGTVYVAEFGYPYATVEKAGLVHGKDLRRAGVSVGPLAITATRAYGRATKELRFALARAFVGQLPPALEQTQTAPRWLPRPRLPPQALTALGYVPCGLHALRSDWAAMITSGAAIDWLSKTLRIPTRDAKAVIATLREPTER